MNSSGARHHERDCPSLPAVGTADLKSRGVEVAGEVSPQRTGRRDQASGQLSQTQAHETGVSRETGRREVENDRARRGSHKRITENHVPPLTCASEPRVPCAASVVGLIVSSDRTHVSRSHHLPSSGHSLVSSLLSTARRSTSSPVRSEPRNRPLVHRCPAVQPPARTSASHSFLIHFVSPACSPGTLFTTSVPQCQVRWTCVITTCKCCSNPCSLPA